MGPGQCRVCVISAGPRTHRRERSHRPCRVGRGVSGRRRRAFTRSPLDARRIAGFPRRTETNTVRRFPLRAVDRVRAALSPATPRGRAERALSGRDGVVGPVLAERRDSVGTHPQIVSVAVSVRNLRRSPAIARRAGGQGSADDGRRRWRGERTRARHAPLAASFATPRGDRHLGTAAAHPVVSRVRISLRACMIGTSILEPHVLVDKWCKTSLFFSKSYTGFKNPAS